VIEGGVFSVSYSLQTQCGLARLACLSFLPVLSYQGNSARKSMPRLPEGGGPKDENWGSKEAVHLLVVGESTVVGVGVSTCKEGLAGQIGHHLAETLRRPVAWRAIGKNGATVKSIRKNDWPPDESEKIDYLVLAFGVNDSLRMRSAAEWAKSLNDIIVDLRTRFGSVPIFFATVPPLGGFIALPQPLRFLLGMRANILEKAALELAANTSHVKYLHFTFGTGENLFASDRFHPSASTYSAWGRTIAEGIANSQSS
jgi:lysophospholipase L1-like esterase